MQSMYLSNATSKTNDLDFFKGYTKEYPQVKTKEFALNFFYSEGNESIYKSGKDFIANLGVFIYKKQFNQNALKLFFQDMKNGASLKDLLLAESTRGQFCLIMHVDGELKVITDRIGYYPLYCYKGDVIEISNTFVILAKNNKTTLNYQGVAEYLSENIVGYACCDKNIVNEITYLDGGSIYSFKDKSITQDRYYVLRDNLEFGKYKSLDEVAERAEEILVDNLSFLKNVEGNVHCDITGGVDTRLNIANIVNQKHDAHFGMQVPVEYKHYTNRGKYSELNIVKRIAKHYNLDLDITNDDDYLARQDLINDITFNMSNKLTYSRRAGYFLQLRDKNNINLIVSGLTGTELHRQPYLNYFDNHDKLEMDTFLRQNYPLVDVIKGNVLAEGDYFSNLKEFFNQELDGLTYEKAEDIVNYIDYFAFFRTHFCRYLVLASSVIPCYTPYGDWRFAKFMLETAYKTKARFRIQRTIIEKLDPELAAINTTRGFPMAKVRLGNLHRFRHMMSRNIPQQYFNVVDKLTDSTSKAGLQFLFANEKAYNLVATKGGVAQDQSTKLNLHHGANEISIIPALKATLKSDLPVFNIVDKEKLGARVKKDCNFNVLNRVRMLNKMLETIGHS